MVLSIANCKINGSGYLYIDDEDTLSEAYATCEGHYHWRFVRDKMNLRDKLQVMAGVGGEVSPPSKLVAKYRKDPTLYPSPNENHHLECQKSSRTSVEKETWEAEIGIEYELD